MLSKRFFNRPTLEVAADLLGKTLCVRDARGKMCSGMIVETEAYYGADPASHAFRGQYLKNGRERRCGPMFRNPGRIYVYGAHQGRPMLNIVARSSDVEAGAVLIRAVEPLQVVEWMKKRRGAEGVFLTNGPAKLCEAMGIRLLDNDHDLDRSRIWIESVGRQDLQICSSQRIGIRHAADRHWRFFIQGNAFVSRHAHNRKSLFLEGQ